MRDSLCRYRASWQGSKFGRFLAKSWTIAHGFEHGGFWQFLEIAPNSLKRLWNPYKMICNSLRDCLFRFPVNWQESKFDRFWAKSLWAIAHGFEHGGFSQVLEIAPISLKRFLNPSKIIFNALRDCLCRLRFNSEDSKIDRFWAKSLGYSPWFWIWWIFESPGNRSKLSETLPKPL